MARIVHKWKYAERVLQLWSALIIASVIGISYLPVNVIFKVIGYAICFFLNYKLIKEKVEGHEVSDEKSKAWKQKRKELVLAKLSEETYNKIKEFVIDNQRASVTLIERTFDLDWHTADAVISKLYEEGIVGEICDHEPREVLVKKKNKENDKNI